jgi:hypothetical protein
MRVAALIVGFALAGCSSVTLAPGAEPPANYRELVSQRARTYFTKPDSIKEAQIAQPMPVGGPALLSGGSPGDGWLVCVRSTAQSFFGYNSLSDTVFVIRGGEVVDVYDSAVQATTCKNEKYEPFPEFLQPA